MSDNTSLPIISNQKIDSKKLEQAKKIILQLQHELQQEIKNGSGPFMAAIYDSDGNLISKSSNSVVATKCSHNHAEMNAIKMAEEKLGTYDLSKYNLTLYSTAEPCIMCLGGIMWSGIRAVYYGVPSDMVSNITGFDEGFKPNWFDEFRKRGILVCGQIETDAGERVLRDHVANDYIIYKPSR